MALDIAGAEMHWLFVLSRGHGIPPKMVVYISPSGSERTGKKLINKLSGLLDIAEDNIKIAVFSDFFPFELENQRNLLFSVDKEV